MKPLRFILLGALVIVLLSAFMPIRGAIFNIAHQVRYRNARVYYHDRMYYNPQSRTFENLPVNGNELIPTGEKVIGLPVMDTPSSMQFQKERNVVPTLLILKLSNDKFLVYSLSGGP